MFKNHYGWRPEKSKFDQNGVHSVASIYLDKAELLSLYELEGFLMGDNFIWFPYSQVVVEYSLVLKMEESRRMIHIDRKLRCTISIITFRSHGRRWKFGQAWWRQHMCWKWLVVPTCWLFFSMNELTIVFHIGTWCKVEGILMITLSMAIGYYLIAKNLVDIEISESLRSSFIRAWKL